MWFPQSKGRTFRDATEAWRKDIKPGLSPSTQGQRESHLRTHIRPTFADAAPRKIDNPTLQSFATRLRKVLSRKTVVQVLITVFVTPDPWKAQLHEARAEWRRRHPKVQ